MGIDEVGIDKVGIDEVGRYQGDLHLHEFFMVASFMQPKIHFQLPERYSQACHINCGWFYVHDQVRLNDDKLCYTGQLNLSGYTVTTNSQT